MAGSFDIFRKYQRSMLVAVAVLAMLAFFVLPPFLQMGVGGGGDPVVATWKGGTLRENDIARAVGVRASVNQFLYDAVIASGRDPGRLRLLPDDEEDVVRTMLLAREADTAGVVVSNAAINEFLGEWTSDLVSPEQFETLLARRRGGPVAVSAADIFEALRQVLAANRMERMFLTGFVGDPPARRWEHFRRLEQAATVEVVPLVVESFAGEVTAPSEATLRTFFDAHKENLPAARSPEPGFREPRRISYDYLQAVRADAEAQAAGEVTDEQIREYYEENKERLYRKTEPDPATDDAPDGGEETKAEDTTTEDPKAENSKPEETEKAGVSEESSEGTQPEPAAADQSAVVKTRATAVAVRQPGGDSVDGETPAGSDSGAGETPAGSDAGAGETPAGSDSGAGETPAGKTPGETPAGSAEKAADEPAEEAAFEPLEKVADGIRERLAAEAANRRIDAIFAAVSGDVGRYAEDRALWQAKITRGPAPTPPDVAVIAEKQGLAGGRVARTTASDALAAGGIASTFDFAADPSSSMGFRQIRWIDLMFADDAPLLRTAATRGVDGDRYLSWKTEDLPPFVPAFAAARPDVERAWRIVEARPLARRLAEAVVAKAGSDGRSLESVIGESFGDEKDSGRVLEPLTAGPFTWLSRGDAFGGPPVVSQPEGLSMPGEEFMEAVFALEPGETAVAFNEPRTVCYVIRLVGYEPDDATLRERFLDPATDPRRIAMIAQRDEERTLEAWMGEVERRQGLTWKRPPRRMR
jgi:hypothetical protein